MTSICDEPLVPAPSPSPVPSSKACVWKSDTVLDGKESKSLVLQSKEECCAACLDSGDGCAASVFDPLTKVCSIRQDVDFANLIWRNDGSLTCIPRTTTTTTESPAQLVV